MQYKVTKCEFFYGKSHWVHLRKPWEKYITSMEHIFLAFSLVLLLLLSQYFS